MSALPSDAMLIADHDILCGAWADIMESLERKGLCLNPWPGFDVWRTHMEPTGLDMNPSFDEGIGTTLEITDRNGNFVAMTAIRLYPNINDIRDLIMSNRIWSSAEAAMMNGMPNYVPLPDDFPVVSGNLVQTGGTYVDPAHRHHRLGADLDKLFRIAAIRGHHADHFFGIAKRPIAQGLPGGFYSVKRMPLVIKDMAINQERTDFYLGHASRSEFIEILVASGYGQFQNHAVASGNGDD